MNSLNSMKSKLGNLTLYDVDATDSLLYAELSAYAKGLNDLYTELEELERESFINTATDYGLDLKEKMYSSIRSNLPINKRREMLNYRCSITSNDFTKESIEKALIAAGIKANIIEMPSQKKIYINCVDFFDTMVTKDVAQYEAEKFLPAHLIYEFDFRPLMWKQIEEKDLMFSEIDDKNLTWNQIDNYE